MDCASAVAALHILQREDGRAGGNGVRGPREPRSQAHRIEGNVVNPG
jgi:hypothetical protein